MERDVRFQSLLLHFSLRFPNKQALLIKQNLTFLSKCPVKEPPPGLCGLLMVPLWREMPVSRANVLIIHSYLSEFPAERENLWSPYMEPRVEERPTYNGVWPDSPRE
jgi:hypothetical protein